MKRKLLALLVAVFALAALAVPAFADIIWEPSNSFYASHRDECSFVDRGYLVNGDKGYVTVYSAPDSLIQVVNLTNGTRFRVAHVWQEKDGRQWGVGYIYLDGKSYEGWVPLDQMALIYDYIAFEEDHGTEFTEYDGSGDHLEQACLYAYPGGSFSHVLEFSMDYMPPSETLNVLYTDENGLRWSFVGYYMGHRDGWLCIDDPMNEHLGVDEPLTVAQVRGEDQPVIDAPQPTQGQAAAPAETIYPPAERTPQAMTWPIWAVCAALVAAVAVVTALLVRRSRRRSLTE